MEPCRLGLGRLPRVHVLVLWIHRAAVDLLGPVTVGAATRMTIRKNDGHVKHVHGLAGEQRALGGDWFYLAVGLEVVIQQVVVPVGGAHLESTGAPLSGVIGPLGHDVGESVASSPIAGTHAFVALHRVRFREIVP